MFVKRRHMLIAITYLMVSTVYIFYARLLIRQKFSARQWIRDKTVWRLREQTHVGNNLTQRLKRFNTALGQLRRKLIVSIGNATWSTRFLSYKLVAFHADSSDVVERLTSYVSGARSLYLPWVNRRTPPTTWTSLADSANLLIQRYYAWTGDRALCNFANDPSVALNWNSRIYSPPGLNGCQDNMSASLNAISLDPAYLDWQQLINPTNNNSSSAGEVYADNVVLFSGHAYTIPKSSLIHLHIVTNAIVTRAGDVTDGKVKVVLPSCSPDGSSTMSFEWLRRSEEGELFVISQQFGHQIYHGLLENVPRLIPFLEFLRKYQRIKIHVYQIDRRICDLLGVLGIASSRLVSGSVRAQVAYIPKSTVCFQPSTPQTQLLNGYYRQYIRNNFPAEPQHRVIMIQRTGRSLSGMRKQLTNRLAVEELVRAAAADFNLTYTVYGDRPIPSFNDTMRMFHSAVMVVAPHGAGESNIVFSVPGIYVIEIVCNPRRQVVMCFKHTAHVLGHHWHGIQSRGQCPDNLDVEPSLVDAAVRYYLKAWQSKLKGV